MFESGTDEKLQELQHSREGIFLDKHSEYTCICAYIVHVLSTESSSSAA